MGTCWRQFCVAGCWLLVGVSAAVGAGRNQVLSTPRLLLDLARDHGLDCQQSRSPSDAEQIRILLQAATRLEPRLTDAYEWLHELAVLRAAPREAAEAVRRLVAASSTHEYAFACWLDAAVQLRQTAEERIDWLEAQLASAPPQPAFQAMVHVRLGRAFLGRVDVDAAREQLQLALSLAPNDPDVVALRLELLGDDAPPEERLAVALAVLSSSPFRVETVWEIALLLDEHGFHGDAVRFYEYADELAASMQISAIPGSYLLQMSRQAAARGEYTEAIDRATKAVAADPELRAEGGMLLYWLLRRVQRVNEANGVREQLARRFAEVREPREWPVNEVAQAAWFYCTIDPQPQRALMLAEDAARRAPGDVFVERVLGWAQVASIKVEQAERTLMPIAGKDAYAAAALARLLEDAGEDEAAQRLLNEMALMPGYGLVRLLVSELGMVAAAPPPAAWRDPRIAEALAQFDPAVLEFHRDPSRFLQAAINLDDRSPAPGEPWWAEFVLTNRARFPITLGPDLMVNPVFLLSFEMEGDRKREYPYLLTISLDESRVIPPGGTVKVRRTIDLGPVRHASRLTPQQLQRITVSAIVDPVCGADGQWRPGPGGQALRPVYFNRIPADTSREALHALFVGLTGKSDLARFRSVEVMAELLGEHQRLALGGLSYKPRAAPATRLQQALLASLASNSWELRARALDALQVAGLDAQMLREVEARLEDSHWLVRLMAVRLLGSRQGVAAAPKLESLARSDPDELVRGMASCYLESWGASTEGTTTAPAAAAGGSPERGAE